MSIKWSDDLITGYLDQELDSAERQFVETEIKNDPAKRALLKKLRRTRKAMRSLPKHRLKTDLADQVLAQAARQMNAADPPILAEPINNEPVSAASRSKPSQGIHRSSWKVAAAMLTGLAAAIVLAFLSVPRNLDVNSLSSLVDSSESIHRNEVPEGNIARRESSENASSLSNNAKFAENDDNGRLPNASDGADDQMAANTNRIAENHGGQSGSGQSAGGESPQQNQQAEAFAQLEDDAELSPKKLNERSESNATSLLGQNGFLSGLHYKLASLALESRFIDQLVIVKVSRDKLKIDPIPKALRAIDFNYLESDFESTIQASSEGVQPTETFLLVDASENQLDQMLDQLGGEYDFMPIRSDMLNIPIKKAKKSQADMVTSNDSELVEKSIESSQSVTQNDELEDGPAKRPTVKRLYSMKQLAMQSNDSEEKKLNPNDSIAKTEIVDRSRLFNTDSLNNKEGNTKNGTKKDVVKNQGKPSGAEERDADEAIPEKSRDRSKRTQGLGDVQKPDEMKDKKSVAGTGDRGNRSGSNDEVARNNDLISQYKEQYKNSGKSSSTEKTVRSLLIIIPVDEQQAPKIDAAREKKISEFFDHGDQEKINVEK